MSMRRSWFRSEDGTYYRNCPLIERERSTRLNTLLPWRRRALEAEWRQAWDAGWISADRIGRRDRIATPAPFRAAYPDHPGLWILDEPTAQVLARSGEEPTV